MKWTLITNVSHVDFNGARLWCRYVTIDEKKNNDLSDPLNIRQIRGATYGGLSVFTLWINPVEDVEIIAKAGGQMVILSQDDNLYNLDSGIIIKTKDYQIEVIKDSHEKPISIETIEQQMYPHGNQVDDLINKYSGGSAYPKVVWVSK